MTPELKSDIGKALKTLRQADSQAAAVAWMTNAYKLLEACLEAGDGPRIIFAREPQKLEIAQSIPTRKQAAAEAAYAAARGRELREISLSKTVVYPQAFLPPGLKPLPKPWTREDTRRLERAAAAPIRRIQRLGK